MAKYIQGAQSSRIDMVEAGKYNLAIVSAEEKTSSNGNPMIKLKLEVLGPVVGEQFPEGTGPVVYDNLVFTQNAFWKIDQFRAACGEEVVEGEEIEIEADDLIGATLQGVLVVGANDKGKERNDVDSYISDDGPF